MRGLSATGLCHGLAVFALVRSYAAIVAGGSLGFAALPKDVTTGAVVLQRREGLRLHLAWGGRRCLPRRNKNATSCTRVWHAHPQQSAPRRNTLQSPTSAALAQFAAAPRAAD